MFALNLFRINADRGEIILDLLEGRGGGLTVSRQIGIIGGSVLMELGTIESAIKDGLRERGPGGPEAAGPAKPCLERGGFGASTGRAGDTREKPAEADPDDGIAFGRGALGSASTLPLFRQFAW